MPIPGRECGGCTVCCSVPPIDTPELKKTAGELCPQCSLSVGCRIYASRPSVCREFECGWRLLDFIPEALRPDASGILVAPDDNGIPPGYADTSGIKFVIVGDASTLANPRLADCIGRLANDRIPMFLAVPGPVGHFFAKAFLNPHVDRIAMSEGLKVLAALNGLFDRLGNGSFEPI